MSFGFFTTTLLRTDHNQGQLTSWLPYFIFLCDLIGVCWNIFGFLVSRLRTFCIINFVPWVVSARIDRWAMFLFLFLYYSPSCENIETCLGLGYKLSILMFFEAYIFFFEVFLIGFTFVHWFGMNIIMESFCIEEFWDIFFWLFCHIHFCTPVKLSCCCCFLSPLSLVGYRVVDICLMLLAIMVHSFWVLLTTCHWNLTFITDIVIRRQFS